MVQTTTKRQMNKEWIPAQHLEELPALTVLQPFGSLIVRGFKTIELRPWHTSYTGWLIIHAGSLYYNQHARTFADYEAGWFSSFRTIERIMQLKPACVITTERVAYPLGAILGIAQLKGWMRFTEESWYKRAHQHCSNSQWYESDRHPGLSVDEGWCFTDYRELRTPIKYRGQQGIYGIPRSILPTEWLDLYDQQGR